MAANSRSTDRREPATERYGATPEEWAHFKRLAQADLLPVVSNPRAPVRPERPLRALGKVPSVYNHNRQAVGLQQWTTRGPTIPRNIDAWKEEPDYGISIRTGDVCAFDCDVPDVQLSRQIAFAFEEGAQVPRASLPRRSRRGADGGTQGKTLIPFRVLWESDSDCSKRSFKVEALDGGKPWLVEFLAKGQQFVAAGTHPSGRRYEWEGDLPAEFPTLTAAQVEAGWAAVRVKFGIPDSEARARLRNRPVGDDLDVDDPVADHLLEHWPNFGIHDGKLLVVCPWKDNHSDPEQANESEAVWFLAGTGGERKGHFDCRHAGCQERTDTNFFQAVGYRTTKPEDFDDLTLEEDDDGGVALYEAMAPSASPKSKELKAEARLTKLAPEWVLASLKLARDSRGRIETRLDNIVRVLEEPRAIGVFLAYDEFRGELMLAEQPEEWRSLGDADAVQLRIDVANIGFKHEIGKELMRDALELVGSRHRFDSAQHWLEREVPEWDGVKRIERLLPDYFGTDDTDYTRAVGRYIMSALAGRIIEPGVKADMVVVLVGPQGIRKSSGIAALSPSEEFFAEFDLEAKEEDKARKMRGCLVGELAELRGLRTRDRESILAWITRRFEKWTPKYKEYETTLPRRCVFFGSTNDDEFLSDPTGERRWLPALVKRLVDVDAIQRDLLQLWAEGRDHFHAEGVDYEEAERLAQDEHRKFKVVDPWLPKIAAWLDSPWDIDGDETPRSSGRLLTSDVLTDCLGLTASKVQKRDQMRVAGVLKQLGMVKVHKRVTTSQKGGHGRRLMDSKVWVDGGENE